VSWQDDLSHVVIGGRRLIGASFRGIPFFVEAAQHTGGRRTETHEFPGRDDPWVDDLGKRAHTFSVDGYVVGDDYVAQQTALIEALEDVEGPGELIHPYLGRKVAICSGFTMRSSSAEGRMVRFSIDFSETPAQPPVPSDAPDMPAVVDESADLALSASRGEFVSAYSVLGMPGFALESLTEALSDGTEFLLDTVAPVISVTQEAAKMTQELELMVATASELVRTPGDVFDSLVGALSTLEATALGAPLSLLQALSAAADFDFGPEPLGDTGTRDRERENRRHLISAFRRVLIVEAARLAPHGVYDTVDYAIETRDQLAAQLESEAESAGDAAYPALVRLRSDVLRSVPPDGTFARVITVSRPVAIPSILLAYQLYGSVDAEDDLVARNRPRHPGFMSGDLQAISDAG